MLTPIALQFGAPSDALEYSGERIRNGFLHAQPTGVSTGVVLGRGGLKEYADLGTSAPVRAMAVMGGKMHVVSGGKLFQMSGTTATDLGTVGDDSKTSISASFTEIAVVASGQYHVYNGTALQSYVNFGALSEPVSVTFQDGYFLIAGTVATRAGGLQVSELIDGNSADALKFANAEGAPDGIEAVISDHREIWVFGTDSIELWYNDGTSGFPFARRAFFERGCANGATVVKDDNAVFWLGNDRTAYRAFGGNPQAISNAHVDRVLRDKTATEAFMLHDRGHKCYCIRFSDHPALAYDLQTQMWNEASTGVGEFQPWAATASVLFEGTWYYGTSGGKVATLDRRTYTDDGDVLEFEVVSAPLMNGGKYVRVPELYAQFAMGDDSRAASNPAKVRLQISHDGRTWDTERTRDMGLLGEYYRPVRFHALGAGRRQQARLRITDEVARDMYGAKVMVA